MPNIDLVTNGIEEDIMQTFGLEAMPPMLLVNIQKRIYEHDRQARSEERRAIMGAMDSLLAKTLG